jgi:hypothetical protein
MVGWRWVDSARVWVEVDRRWGGAGGAGSGEGGVFGVVDGLAAGCQCAGG